MKDYKRVFCIVIDSVGCGNCPDSYKYGDSGVNTLNHLSYSKPNFNIPTLAKLGIGNITDINNAKPTKDNLAAYGKCQELSIGKDTLTGHFEIMGLEVTKKFPSFTENGFPKELIDMLEKESGHEFIGNYAASGTEIIKELGLEHMKTGKIIIYTSADSVLQLAANESVVSVPELYRVCEIARKITLDNPDWMVGRIIARPFIGTNPDNFIRTPRRHDYAIKPFGRTCLDILKDNKLDVIAIGKIRDIFDGEGITESTKIVSNHDGMMKTIEVSKTKDFNGLCFVNLVDFDALYGHRRNPIGYAECLEEFDNDLNEFIKTLKDNDLLIICADHGNDPTHTGTDHTREYIPLIVYSKNINPINLGTRNTFADIGTTICDNFNLKGTGLGTSFLKDITK